MSPSELESYSLGPTALAFAGVVSVLVGALLLMGVVRWTEGFSISFGQSVKVTVLGVLAALLGEFVVFAILFRLGYTSLGAYSVGLLVTMLLAAIASAALYGYMIKRPTGERIGVARAVKVTFIQLAMIFAIAFVIALAIAVLMMTGVVSMPELPGDLMIQ